MIIPEPTAPGENRAKLVDFGLVKLIRVFGPHTTSALIMGTPAYMSPEQCRGAGQVDAKTDCYALGVMLYELLAGRLPFDSQWAGDLIGMHLHVEPPPLSQCAPDIDKRLTALVHDLLIKDKNRRPAMAEVASYLNQLLTELEGGSEAAALPPLNPGVDVLAPTLAGPSAKLVQAEPAARSAASFRLPQPDQKGLPKDRSKGFSRSAGQTAANSRRLPREPQNKLELFILLGVAATLLLGWSIYTIASWVRELTAQSRPPAIASSDKPASSVPIARGSRWIPDQRPKTIPRLSLRHGTEVAALRNS